MVFDDEPVREPAELRVLFVEDDAHERYLWTQGLKEQTRPTFQIVEALNLQHAQLLVQMADLDAIVLDLGLPDAASEMEGLRRLADAAPHIPIVVLTGEFDHDSIAVQAAAEGAEDCLFKNEDGPARLARSIRCAVLRNGKRIPDEHEASEIDPA